jgi:hypothetical protein
MWSRIRRTFIPSKASPTSNKRACLCDDGLTYSRKCCKGGIWNQGIGSITGRREYELQQETGFAILQENGNKILID